MSDALPWDAYPTELPELPYRPPAVRPLPPAEREVPPAIDMKQIAIDLLNEAAGYARARRAESGRAIPAPGVPVTDADHALVVADAKSRSGRTLVQGLLVDLGVALIAGVATLAGADLLSRGTWVAFGVLLAKSFVSAGISYFMRLKVQPTIKTPGQRMAVMPLPRRLEKAEKP